MDLARAGRSGGAFDPSLLSRLQGLDWKARYVMEGFLSGVHGSPFHGPSVEFRDYRDYQPGDDLRRVDWRLYARSDRLSVKRYEQETNARCYILCDTSASMEYRGSAAWGSKLECARVLALALGWLLLKQNDAVGLLALQPGRAAEAGGLAVRYVRPSQKPHQAGLLLRGLTGLAAGGGPLLPDLLEHAVRVMHRRSLLVLLTDLLEPAQGVEQGLRRLRFAGHDCACIQVLDRDEVELPFEGDLLLEDVESGARRRVDAARVRETYVARFRAFMDEHRRLLRDLEIPWASIRTDEDPGRALARAVGSRARVA
jgi:uncharacterized protein (DUF58 family)